MFSFCVVKVCEGIYDWFTYPDGEEHQEAEKAGFKLMEICGTKEAAERSIKARLNEYEK